MFIFTSDGLRFSVSHLLILHFDLVLLLFVHTLQVPQFSGRRQPSQALHRFRRVRGVFFIRLGEVSPFIGVTGVPGEPGEGRSSPGDSRGVFIATELK